MLPDQETELKLALLDPSIFERVAADPFPGSSYNAEKRRTLHLDNAYYDTADHRLMSAGFMLRVRDTGEGLVATVKDKGTTSGGLFIRGEWNVPLTDGMVSAGTFRDTPVGERLMEAAGQAALEPIFKTVFRRVSMEIRFGDTVAEFAADQGEITAGDKSMPLCEVELELKSGDAAGLIRLGAALSENCPLMIERRSKFERGLILSGLTAGNTGSGHDSSSPTPNITGRTVKAVMSENMAAALQSALDRTAHFFTKPGVPETAHQLRVSLRRLRALLSFAKPALDGAVYKELSQKLRGLAGDFSTIRERDVMLEVWRAFRRKHPEVSRKKYGLEAVLRSERRKEQTRLTKPASVGAATAVLLHVWAQLLGDIWTKQGDADLTEFTVIRLKKWTAQFWAVLKTTSFKDLKKVHALRILGKKIRYVLDAFPECGGESARLIKKDLKHLQNMLGKLCDTGRNTQILDGLMKTRPEPLTLYEIDLLKTGERQRFKDLAIKLKKEVSK